MADDRASGIASTADIDNQPLAFVLDDSQRKDDRNEWPSAAIPEKQSRPLVAEAGFDSWRRFHDRKQSRGAYGFVWPIP
jgi:hypothetical protein